MSMSNSASDNKGTKLIFDVKFALIRNYLQKILVFKKIQVIRSLGLFISFIVQFSKLNY